jgi:hypothetical protein
MKKLFSLIVMAVLTMSVMAQTKRFYEWKDGVYTERSISEIDSITFSLPPEVDLGLPSGTLWANRNVGADNPEDYGDYFAWGETATKSTYSWNNYKWCNGTSDSQTKYCTKDSYGTVDDLTTLESEDDAATANWGKQWRMPTYEEMNELRTECTWTWTTQNSVNGYKVTGPNGNSIFLPAAGYRNGSDLYSVGSSGYYWLRSLNQSYPSSAYYLYFYSEFYGTRSDSYRSYGHPVRAVMQ